MAKKRDDMDVSSLLWGSRNFVATTDRAEILSDAFVTKVKGLWISGQAPVNRVPAASLGLPFLVLDGPDPCVID
jgi:hypothetical protein